MCLNSSKIGGLNWGTSAPLQEKWVVMSLFFVGLQLHGRVHMIEKYVKTECGLNKYSELKTKEGVFAKARLYWFIFFATLRDFPKQKIKRK